jgi:predicted Rossmann-fold nucleotide-binding protein
LFPGGFGTLEELLKCSLGQLGLKTIAILNTNGFYDALIVLLNNMV